MIQKVDNLFEDIQKVKQVPIIHTLLEVVCRTTGLGFAAVARVTSDRWIACSVRDEIDFGLQEGGELNIETTICRDIRASRKAVIIDNVDLDEVYRDHITPRMYGFKSYISVPIYLKDGSFFGTLCAIDPKPAQLNNAQTLGLFMLLTDLLSFHLQRFERGEQSSGDTRPRRRVAEAGEVEQQYHYASDRSLSEPLRKLRLLSDMMIGPANQGNTEEVATLAAKVRVVAEQLETTVHDVSHYARLTDHGHFYEQLKLQDIVTVVKAQLYELIQEKRGVIDVIDFPTLAGIRFHLEHLFYRLIHNALTFSRQDVPVLIQLYSYRMWGSELQDIFAADAKAEYLEIMLEDNGRGIEPSTLEELVQLFSRTTDGAPRQGHGMGLAYCHKIVRFHGGFITVKSTVGQGSTFTVFLPVSPIPTPGSRV